MIDQPNILTHYINSTVIIMTALVAFFLTALSGFLLIPHLKRLKYGQTIKEIGPKWHQGKQGTPTMGGLMFIVGIVVAAIIGFMMLYQNNGMMNDAYVLRFLSGIFMALAFSGIGYWDDYIKIVKKRNLGLSARHKFLFQLLIATGYLLTLELGGVISTIVEIPFFGQIQLGLFYYPLMVLLIVGFTNAVNLTDGVDGLASSVTFVFGVAFIFYSVKLAHPIMGILAVAVAAGCLGFLVWNFHPAKVFMGDTGSMFLGGCVVALAFAVDLPLLLLLGGIVYFCEAGSVILQVLSFKLTGKRIFKMSPIHHHFEMSGWSEVKIVMVFSAVTVVFCIIGFFALPIY